MAKKVGAGSPAVRGSKTGRPIMVLLDLLGRRWSLRILWELREGALTSRALRAACGDASPTVMQQRLTELREAGFIELREEGDDHAGRRFRWEVLVSGGRDRGFGSPDNIGFDARGNLWIVTDGEQPHGGNNGCYVFDLAGGERGALRQFMSGPVGAEICGCEFTPDNRTLFLSVQHPGETGTLGRPTSHWPDGGRLPPRASVIAVRRADGDIVGS